MNRLAVGQAVFGYQCEKFRPFLLLGNGMLYGTLFFHAHISVCTSKLRRLCSSIIDIHAWYIHTAQNHLRDAYGTLAHGGVT